MSQKESESLYQRARSAVRRVVNDFLLFEHYPAIYRKALKEAPLDERKVLFVEGKMADMPDAYTLLWGVLDGHPGYDPVYITLEQNVGGFINYVRNCEQLVRDIASAKYVFLNDASNVVSCLPLRPETKVVQLWHACGAFKKWGMSTAELNFGGTREEKLRHPFYANLSLVTVSSPEVEWAYREAMVLEDTPEIVQPIGVSRTDVFLDPGFLATAREAVERCHPACKGKKAILYAPTFRGHVSTAKGPDQLDIELMRERLGDDYVVLIRHHPFVKRPPSIPESCSTFAFQADGRLPIDVLLAAADICMTDYSSVVFEYSLMGRPLVFFAPDLDDYSDWRGFYYDYDELTPGPVFRESADLVEWIADIDQRFDKGQVEAFRERFMSACDGHATERIFAAVFGPAASGAGRSGSVLKG